MDTRRQSEEHADLATTPATAAAAVARITQFPNNRTKRTLNNISAICDIWVSMSGHLQDGEITVKTISRSQLARS